MSGVTLTPATASVEVGKTVELTVGITPTNATNQTATAKSGTEANATVAISGTKATVTGVAAGTSEIEVTVDGKTAKSTITVTAPTAG